MQKQKQDIRELMEKRPEYLVVVPVRSVGLKGILQEAQESGTRIILVNGSVTGLDESKIFCSIEADAGDQGTRCAQMLMRQMGEGKRTILELQSDNGTTTMRERSTGFRKELCRYEGYEIEAVLRAENERIDAYKQVMAFLSEPSRRADAVFAHYGRSGNGSAGST